MPQTIDRDGARTRANDPRSRRRHGGPVILATFASATFETQAARLAVEAAGDMGSTLLVVDMVEVRPGRRGAGAVTDPVPPAQHAALRRIAGLAEELGVFAGSLRVPSLRPVTALLALVAERRPALVVFGTDPAVLRRFRQPSRRTYRGFLDALADQATCLLWTAADPAAGAAPPAARRPAKRRAPVRPTAFGGFAAAPSPSTAFAGFASPPSPRANAGWP